MNITYKITPHSLGGHLFEVELLILKPSSSGVNLSLPTWIPGSYLVRDFSKHLGAVSCVSDGKSVRIQKKSKNRWRISPCTGPLRVSYQVYAHDLSVRGAHLDSTHGFFNGSSVFLCVDDQQDEAVGVEICPPEDPSAKSWRLATTLTPVDAEEWGFGTFSAQSYDELIDHPVEMGEFELAEFKVQGTPHYFVLSGHNYCNLQRLAKDAQTVCEQQVSLFGELPKMDRYLFLTRVETNGYGGLEHRNCCALVCSRIMLPINRAVPDKAYRQFLGLVSHEYFHLWNVKRIKPAVFLPYDLDNESYTEQLWIFEGITSYYDDLALVRSGLIDEQSYFELIAKTISRVLAGYGNQVQSLADSSYDTWVKFYKPDDNTPNAVVSYYAKGSLVALCLDLIIRQRTSNKFSLDDVMSAMWEKYGKPFVGVPEDGFEEIADQVTGLHLHPFFEAMVRDTKALPLPELLQDFGLHLSNDKNYTSECTVELGLQFTAATNVIKHVRRHSCSELAGIAAGDSVVAVDHLKVEHNNVSQLLRAFKPGDQVTVHVFRRGQLMEFDVVLTEAMNRHYEITIRDDDSSKTRRRRRDWIQG